MKSRILIYDSDEEDSVQNDILPEFGSNLRASYPYTEAFIEEIEEDEQVVTFLSDEQLKSFLLIAIKRNLEIALLPHPKMIHGIKGFGVKSSLEDNIAYILLEEKVSKVDVLEANGVPVFNTILIGESLSLMSSSVARFGFQRFWQRLSYFFKLFWSTKLVGFNIKAENQDEINTAAIGLIIVHHAQSSLISKKTTRAFSN